MARFVAAKVTTRHTASDNTAPPGSDLPRSDLQKHVHSQVALEPHSSVLPPYTGRTQRMSTSGAEALLGLLCVRIACVAPGQGVRGPVSVPVIGGH